MTRQEETDLLKPAKAKGENVNPKNRINRKDFSFINNVRRFYFMRTLSANDVQKFLGGVLAYIGFQAVVQTAFLIVGPAQTDSMTIIVTAIPSLALLIGIQMLMGSSHAVSWALVFLAVYIVLGLGGAALALVTSSPPSPIRSYVLMSSGVNLVAPAILLCALLWCRSKLLRDEANA